MIFLGTHRICNRDKLEGCRHCFPRQGERLYIVIDRVTEWICAEEFHVKLENELVEANGALSGRSECARSNGKVCKLHHCRFLHVAEPGETIPERAD